jgi:hypothetical protein
MKNLILIFTCIYFFTPLYAADQVKLLKAPVDLDDKSSLTKRGKEFYKLLP